MRFVMESIDAAELVDQTLLDLRSIAEEKNIELTGQAGRFAVFCDAKRIEQVISNLIKNSVDFVPAKGGRVAVKVGKSTTTQNTAGGSKEMALFSVEDNGPGIPADKVENIFKKFYQIDTSVTRKHGGTGLGLVICRGIVEAHGGRIWVDTSYKNGACLKFTLLLSDSEGSD
jgi:signal transduction histidine kinase